MGQFSVEKPVAPGSALSGNQLLAIVGVAMLLERTRLGLAMRALASNRAVSSLIGISAPRVDAWPG